VILSLGSYQYATRPNVFGLLRCGSSENGWTPTFTVMLLWDVSGRLAKWNCPVCRESQMVRFWKTDPRLVSPSAYAYARGGPQISPENEARRSVPASTWSLVVALRLEWRSRILLTGAGVDAPLSIDTGYLNGSGDVARVAAADRDGTRDRQPASTYALRNSVPSPCQRTA
jgi:hypothetical protein